MDLISLKSFARDSRKVLLKTVSFTIDNVLSKDSAARRENPKAIIELENKIQTSSKEEVIEEVSYTWFNRFIALQYMDINGFNNVRVILPLEGMKRPEILSKVMGGVFTSEYISANTKNIISSLLDGGIPSNDPEKEVYKLLIVSFCNKLHSKMPFLFERIADYKELLIPDDLLSNSSILVKMRDVMTNENCKDVEIIGWLYQFYISDKKDEVFSSLKMNKKIMAESIPAATQLFTPHWIVKYLVENSIGRLWMLNNPNSKLVNKMEFYINSQETEFLRISSPEEIKICDPACGSGHMLTYAFDLLFLIYEEEGYSEENIPSLILENNLYGIEIDKRAGDLAAFALTMKAREKNKKFFKFSIQPNICILENIQFHSDELNEYKSEVGIDLFNSSLESTVRQFEESNNFGSLIKPHLHNINEIYDELKVQNFTNDIFLDLTHKKVLKAIKQSIFLDKRYHIVVANPPYMGAKGMNSKLSKFAKDVFPDSKSDLFSMFVERSMSLVYELGYLSFLTMQSWMFLGSYSKFRKMIYEKNHLMQMFHTGPGLFPELGSFNVLTTTFLIKIGKIENKKSCLFIKGNDSPNIPKKIQILKDYKKYKKLDLSIFDSIPGKPLVYWLSENSLKSFSERSLLGEIAEIKAGLQTCNNKKFLRLWSEVSFNNINFNCTERSQTKNLETKWYPYNKGGDYRKWYGNNEFVVNWKSDGLDIHKYANIPLNYSGAPVRAKEYYFKEGLVYSLFGFENFGVRYKNKGFIFDVSGASIFLEDWEIILAFLCSNVAFYFLKALAPTVNFQVGDISRLPIPLLSLENKNQVVRLSRECVQIVREDWDSYETSWDFKKLRLLSFKVVSLSKAIEKEINKQFELRNILKFNEEKINSILIDDFQLEKDVKKEVPERDISIKLSTQKEVCLEFISYGVGCMFGRYSLNEPGFIIANQGETIEDYLKENPNPLFMPDEDNVIPCLELDWFEDDITARFKKFLKVTFGEENFEENLRFLENHIGKEIRKYFLNDFYKDHIQKYKKRPIYWMFSSPNGSFNALIYLHRYNRDTVSIVLEKYLREYLSKLRAEKNTLERIEVNNDSSSLEKTKAMKNIQRIESVINELKKWEKEVIFPLASQRIEIDLDDGVKINYLKFGAALKKISGLN